MEESVLENKISFKSHIPLNQQMLPQEAIDELGAYHKASPESVLSAFKNLRGFEEGVVVFRDSVNGGRSCIVMEGRDNDGTFVWNHLIDDSTGQPLTRTS